MAGGGLMQLVAYGATFPEYFICDIEMKTLGRIYNTFKVINLYEDDFKISTTVPNFYDDNFNF